MSQGKWGKRSKKGPQTFHAGTVFTGREITKLKCQISCRVPAFPATGNRVRGLSPYSGTSVNREIISELSTLLLLKQSRNFRGGSIKFAWTRSLSFKSDIPWRAVLKTVAFGVKALTQTELIGKLVEESS